VKQIEKCPRSLIIIDEVQYIHSSTLRVLQQFMEETDYVVKKDGSRLYKNEAIIGLVSDFGREGRTKDLTLEELEELVNQHTRELWDSDPKQIQLIQYTFPFVSLSDEDLEMLLRYLITVKLPNESLFPNQVKSIQVSETALSWMRYKVRKIFPNENGRGADKYVDRLIPKLRKAILDKSQSNTRASYNIDIRFRCQWKEVRCSKKAKSISR